MFWPKAEKQNLP